MTSTAPLSVVTLLAPRFDQKARWAERHMAAVYNPTSLHERAVVGMFTALQELAEAHQARFECAIGDDYVLGAAWKDVANGLLAMLNGETGRLDCGTIDAAIRNLAAAHNVPLEE